MIQEACYEDALSLFDEVNELVEQLTDFNRKLDLRGQVDSLRQQLEDSVLKKIRFNGSKDLIIFATERLRLTDVVDSFLDNQSIRLQAVLTKIQPCDYEAINGAKEHPLRIAGIMNMRSTSSKQQQTQEVASFVRDVQKQQELLEALMRAFDDFVKRRVIEQYDEIFAQYANLPQDETSAVVQPPIPLPNNQALSIWLTQTATEMFLCHESLTQFFQNPHILASLNTSLKIVFRALQQLQSVNINITQQVERLIAPVIVKQIMLLLEEVLQHGLDHDVNQSQTKGVKKYARANNNSDDPKDGTQSDISTYILDKLRFKLES